MHAKTCLSLTPPLSFSLEFVPPPKTPLLPLSGVKAHLPTVRRSAFEVSSALRILNSSFAGCVLQGQYGSSCAVDSRKCANAPCHSSSGRWRAPVRGCMDDRTGPQVLSTKDSMAFTSSLVLTEAASSSSVRISYVRASDLRN